MDPLGLGVKNLRNRTSVTWVVEVDVTSPWAGHSDPVTCVQHSPTISLTTHSRGTTLDGRNGTSRTPPCFLPESVHEGFICPQVYSVQTYPQMKSWCRHGSPGCERRERPSVVQSWNVEGDPRPLIFVAIGPLPLPRPSATQPKMSEDIHKEEGRPSPTPLSSHWAEPSCDPCPLFLQSTHRKSRGRGGRDTLGAPSPSTHTDFEG